MKEGIRFRLLILVLGIVIPLAYVGLIGIRALWDANRQQTNSLMKKQAELAAIAFDQWVEAQREYLAALPVYFDSRLQNQFEQNQIASRMVTSRMHWVGLHLLSANGESNLAQPPDAPPLSTDMAMALLSQLQDRAWVVDTDWTQGQSQSILLIAVPLAGGAAIAQINVVALSETLFQEFELSDQAVLAIVGPQHRILLYRNNTSQTYLGADLSSSSFFTALGNQRAAVVEAQSPIDEVRRVYGLARAGDTGVVVIVGAPSEALFGMARNHLYRYMWFSLIALLLALVSAWIIARSIAGPLGHLSRASRSFGAGNLATRAHFQASGEIEELRSSFNAMAAQIEEREARLTELDQLKSDFVSGVSHEMRTPLTTIKTLTRVLLRAELSQAERLEYLETIAAECDRQIDLVLNLLDLSRIESGTFSVSLTGVDVAEVLQSCVVIEQHNAESHRHELRADLPVELGQALADRLALRRVLCGLIENAIKYTMDGGRIILEAQSLGQEIVIAIRDTGRGIPPDDLPHIFDKFYRGRFISSPAGAGDSLSKPAEVPGVGLGLYLAKTIIEKIGGRISVESVFGAGSTFRIHLPRYEATEKQVMQSEET